MSLAIAPVTVDLGTVKLRLNKTLTVDDGELQTMLDAAMAEYVEWVGPLGGSVTETFDSTGTTLVLRQAVNTITAVSYDSGDTIAVSDLTVSNGIVRWAYGTTGQFLPGRRVSITYTAPTPPANHLEVIAADVAGYFEATQRSDGAGQASYPGEGEYEAAYAATPQILFPRIRNLAKQYPLVG